MARQSSIRGQVHEHLTGEFVRRGRRALQIYTRTRLVRDQPGYPFAQRPEDGSIRDRRNQSITRIPGGVRIKVESRGAPFKEEGNDARGAFIYPRDAKSLAIPLKGRRKKGGRVVIGDDGRPYLAVPRVRTYKGTHQLRRSIQAAFIGGPPGRIRRSS